MADDKIKGHSNRILIVLLCIAVLGGGAVLWHKVIKDHVIAKNFGVVEEGLIYRSGRICRTLIKKTLIRYKIKTIIKLTGDKSDDNDQIAEKKAADELNIKILSFPLRGNGTGDPNLYIGAVTALIESARQKMPVLVHCAAGAQRTGGVIAVYRLLVEQKDPAFVISEMKKYGWSFHKNPELLKYLNENMEMFAKALRQKGIVEGIPSPLPELTAE